ncbi:MAG: glycosyl hydrolase family 8 [Acetobacteraceae bacterium]|nr:glycosyl hydrolase family 8 [Acetobacteraceae bacterium]
MPVGQTVFPRPSCVLSRRGVLAGAVASLGLAGEAAAEPMAPPTDVGQWHSFRDRFIQSNGRVLDTANGGISHSEGQGWGMLFAARFDDRESFVRISDWRRRVLKRGTDALHAWRCRAGPDEVVDDYNNATDGDLLIAWGLLEAAARWQDAALFAEGRALAQDILRLLVRAPGGRTLLVPGLRGFEHPTYVVVNPSYYIFPAFPVLADAVPDPAWVQIAAHGIALLRTGRFGRWQLPPDWLAVTGRTQLPRPAPGWPTRFSYDAVRVPLYMAWAGLAHEPAVVAAARMWGRPASAIMPAWVDLMSGQSADYPAPTGIRAIAHLAIAASSGQGGPAQMPDVAEADDYYSAALTLLSRLAWRDVGMPA